MSKHDAKAAAAPIAPAANLAPLALAARLVVGGLLIYTGAMKAAAPAEEFAVVIEMYDILPPGNATTAAAFLPWAELLVGWALVLGFLTRLTAAGAMAMFSTFILAIISTKARGIQLPHCGCFGGAFLPTPSVMLCIDLVLVSLSFAAFKYGPGAPSLDNWADRTHT